LSQADLVSWWNDYYQGYHHFFRRSDIVCKL